MKLKKFLALVNIPIAAVVLFTSLTSASNIVRASGRVVITGTPSVHNDIKVSMSENTNYGYDISVGQVNLTPDSTTVAYQLFLRNFGTSQPETPLLYKMKNVVTSSNSYLVHIKVRQLRPGNETIIYDGNLSTFNSSANIYIFRNTSERLVIELTRTEAINNTTTVDYSFQFFPAN